MLIYVWLGGKTVVTESKKFIEIKWEDIKINQKKKGTSAQNIHIVSEHKAMEKERGRRAKLSKVGVQ